MTSDGETTLEGKTFLAAVERNIRRLLPSVSTYRARPADDALWVSFGDQNDFVDFVRAASGVNIATSIGSTFKDRGDLHKSLSICYLQLVLENSALTSGFCSLLRTFRRRGWLKDCFRKTSTRPFLMS